MCLYFVQTVQIVACDELYNNQQVSDVALTDLTQLILSVSSPSTSTPVYGVGQPIFYSPQLTVVLVSFSQMVLLKTYHHYLNISGIENPTFVTGIFFVSILGFFSILDCLLGKEGIGSLQKQREFMFWEAQTMKFICRGLYSILHTTFLPIFCGKESEICF